MERSRIIDVTRKPRRCPVCKGKVVDIIYGTGDMTEFEFLFQYRKSAMMGGDNIPRNPPIWACSCGCKRFRKVNYDGSVAPVKVKMLKNVRREPLSLMNIESDSVEWALRNDEKAIHYYKVRFTTVFGESDVVNVTALSEEEAILTVEKLVARDILGLRGLKCESTEILSVDTREEIYSNTRMGHMPPR